MSSPSAASLPVPSSYRDFIAWLQTRDTLLGYLQQPLSNRQRSLVMPESAALVG